MGEDDKELSRSLRNNLRHSDDGEIVEERYRHDRLNQIKIRVQLAEENRLMMPLTFYVNDITYLLGLLGEKAEKE